MSYKFNPLFIKFYTQIISTDDLTKKRELILNLLENEELEKTIKNDKGFVEDFSLKSDLSLSENLKQIFKNFNLEIDFDDLFNSLNDDTKRRLGKVILELNKEDVSISYNPTVRRIKF